MNVSEILSAVGKKCYLLIDVNLQNGQYDKLINIDGSPKLICGQHNYDQIMRNDVLKKVSPDDQKKMIDRFSMEGLREQLRQHNSFEFEYQKKEQKETKWVRISANVVKREKASDGQLENNHVVEAVIGFTDITAERIHELELRKREKRLIDVIEAQNEQLKHNLRYANSTNNAKTQFLSDLSHEMRASINAIMGLAEIARKNYDQSEIMKELMENMQSPIDNLTNLLGHMTDVRMIESGKMSAKYGGTNLKEVVKSCCEILHTECKKKKQHFQLSYRNIKHEIFVTDEVRLKQILINVLENAIKYTQEEGNIILEVTEMSCPGKLESRYCFIVEDNGCGMQKEFLDTVFEPFAKSKDTSENVGIGLSIVKNLTEMLNGQVKIYSCPDKGTKVVLSFQFPYADQYLEDKKDGETSSNLLLKRYENLSGKKLLLVEDERIHRQILVYILEEQGMICDWANTGEEAIAKLKLAEDGFYNGVITDIRLPGMKGDELTRRLRDSSRKYLQNIPIIAVSADAMIEDMQLYMRSGITVYLTKPVVPENLYQVLNQLLA